MKLSTRDQMDPPSVPGPGDSGFHLAWGGTSSRRSGDRTVTSTLSSPPAPVVRPTAQSRVVQKFLQNLPGMPSVSVTNRVGGGGSIAMHFLTQQPGDAHYIGVLSTPLLTNTSSA